MYVLTVKSDFSAAHALRGYKGKCEELHGHNWTVELSVSAQELDELGLAADFKLLKAALEQELEELDHHHLNKLEPFDRINPSSENLARVLFERLSARLADVPVVLLELAVWESPDARAAFRPDHLGG